MDSLVESLAGSFSVSSAPNNTAAPHPRFSQYKQKSSSQTQEERRYSLLTNQKKKRFDFISHARRLAFAEFDNDEEEEEEDADEAMEQEARPNRSSYRDQLMLSEWLVDIPGDFAEEWLMLPCPTGKRTLVVASKGRTCAYGKNGGFIKEFPSDLPGGCRNKTQTTNHSRNSYTLLDCVFSQVNKTFYILDVMCWSNHTVFDCETEFRSFWLQTKLEEYPDLGVCSRLNPYKFIAAKYHPCDAESMSKALLQPNPYQDNIDGLLFYHKRTHYTPGSTPLVGWLKAFMVSELFDIKISDEYLQERPTSYTGYKQHIDSYEQQIKQRDESRSQEKQQKWQQRDETRSQEKQKWIKDVFKENGLDTKEMEVNQENT